MGQRKSENNKHAMAAVRLIVLAAALGTAAALGPNAAAATEYTVGDATGWDFAPTTSYYEEWSSRRKFLPGDKLVFKYLPSAHNVQEVTAADYTACSSANPIAEYETGNDIVSLPKVGTHYYICGFLGHCDEGGMKLKTVVVDHAPNTSTPSPSPAPSKPPSGSQQQLPSPLTSIVPQIPGGEAPPGHGRGHGAHGPVAAPVAAPRGRHSRGTPRAEPVGVGRLLGLAFGVAVVGSLAW